MPEPQESTPQSWLLSRLHTEEQTSLAADAGIGAADSRDRAGGGVLQGDQGGILLEGRGEALRTLATDEIAIEAASRVANGHQRLARSAAADSVRGLCNNQWWLHFYRQTNFRQWNICPKGNSNFCHRDVVEV